MTLPTELLWAAGGHASDIALTALADGEHALVPPEVRAHVESCTACTAHLGNAALLALYTQSELEARAQHERVRRPLPRVPIALGLVAAALGLVPSLVDVDAAALRRFFGHDLHVYIEGLGTVTRHLSAPGGAVGIIAPWIVATLLVALGFTIVRFLPTKDHAS